MRIIVYFLRFIETVLAVATFALVLASSKPLNTTPAWLVVVYCIIIIAAPIFLASLVIDKSIFKNYGGFYWSWVILVLVVISILNHYFEYDLARGFVISAIVFTSAIKILSVAFKVPIFEFLEEFSNTSSRYADY